MKHVWIRRARRGYQYCTKCGKSVHFPPPLTVEHLDDCLGWQSEGTKVAELVYKSMDDERIENNPPVAPIIPGDPMRLQYRVLKDSEKYAMGVIKSECEALWVKLDNLGSSREISIAKTKLEEACMWAAKHYDTVGGK